MKIGIFVSDTGGERTGVEELQRRAQWVEENGFTSAWVPADPVEPRRADRAHARGRRSPNASSSAPRSCPRTPDTRSPSPSRRCRCRRRAAAGSRSASARRTRWSSRTCTGSATRSRTRTPCEYLEVLERAFAGPGQVHFEGDEFRVNALLDVPGGTPVPMLIAALAPEDAAARRQPHRGHDHVDGRRALDRGVRRTAARRRGDGGRPIDTAGGRRLAARRVRRRRRRS